MKSKKLSPLAVYLVCAAAIVLLLAADQYTKSLAVQYLKDQPSIELVDFIYVSLINFPVFNVADIYVTVSVAVFLLLYLLYYKDEDFAFLHKNAKKEESDG